MRGTDRRSEANWGMASAKEPIWDERRLAALRASGLLNAPAEPAFDRITRLVQSVLHVPVALVTLIDADRQFFLSHCGLPDAVAAARGTPLSYSFCKHVVNRDEALVINDARTNPLVSDNPAVCELGVIAYLGVPMRDANGMVLGSLCAIDTHARQWTSRDVELLTSFSRQLTAEMGLRAQSLRLAGEVLERRDTESTRRTMHRLDIHELRAPLSAMLLGLEVINYLGPLTGAQQSYLTLCRHKGDTLFTMINNLVDIDIIEQRGEAALRREPVRVLRAIDAAVLQVVALAEEKPVRIDLAEPFDTPPVFADLDKLVRVLVSLLTNAIQHTGSHGSVTVSARVVPGDMECVEFKVADTGVGIADVSTLFDDSARERNVVKTHHTSGLGLIFCKRVVEAHRGTIHATSRLGEGTTIRFTIPTAPFDMRHARDESE